MVTSPTPPPPPRRKRWQRPPPQLTWISHPRISRHLREHDCNVIGLLAEMAKDARIDPQLRYRVLEKLVMLLYLPCEPATPVRPAKAASKNGVGKADVAKIIADAWKTEPKL